MRKCFFRIGATSRFISSKSVPDKDFSLMREIMIRGILENNQDKVKNDTNFQQLSNLFEKTGIGYFIRLNSGPSYSKYVVDSSSIQGFNRLPPFEHQTNFEAYSNPNSELTIFAQRNMAYGTYCIGFSISSWSCGRPFDTEDKTISDMFLKKDSLTTQSFIEKFLNLEFLRANQNPVDDFYDYTSSTHEQAKLSLKFETLDVNALSKDQLQKEYPLHMGKVLKIEMENKDTNKLKQVVDLKWKKVELSNGTYIGQLNEENNRHGVGCYIFTGKSYFVGNFENNERNGHIEEYNENDRLTFNGNYLKGKRNGFGSYYFENGCRYEGEYKNDVKHGKGSYFFSQSQKYIGEFVDDKKQGKGIYYYNDNEWWDGTFLNDQFHGTGTYKFASGDKVTMQFSNGKKVK